MKDSLKGYSLISHPKGCQMDTFINEKHKGGLNYLMSDMMKKIRGRLMVISEKINLRSCKLMNAYKYSYDYWNLKIGWRLEINNTFLKKYR